MFITKKYGLVSSRSEYIMLAYADRICRERHKAENEVVRRDYGTIKRYLF